MNPPLDSVVIFAQLSFSGVQQKLAQQLLDQVADWDLWLEQIEVHGLSGFANKHIKEYDLQLPSKTALSLRALSMRHQGIACARYITLREIDRVFTENDIPYIGLKGVSLMPLLYKSAELRPMRDMDILVPKRCKELAADCMRAIGFDLPTTPDNQFSIDMHQLPNATKTVDGFLISVEVHLDAYTRETVGHLRFPDEPDRQQLVNWEQLALPAFENIEMLHQVTRHLESLHPDATLKLINVMDVIGLANHVLEQGQWQALEQRYPHVLTTLRCLYLYTPLPSALLQQLGKLSKVEMSGVGEIMDSLSSSLLHKNKPLKTRLINLFSPSDWWMHLYYNVDPEKSLLWVKLVRHPLRIMRWLGERAVSFIRTNLKLYS